MELTIFNHKKLPVPHGRGRKVRNNKPKIKKR
jgi:hypothetical protein